MPAKSSTSPWRSRRLAFISLLLLLAFPAGCRDDADAGTDTADGPLRVAAAISLKDVMEDLAGAWEAQSGNRIVATYASSGQLAAQVAGGAPIDLFISAGVPQVTMLEEGGHIDSASVRTITANALVLVAPVGAETPSGWEALADNGVRRIAIGHPDTVPAGRYAKQALERLGLYERLSERLVHGANVRQVLNYVELGEVDAGIVYRTDAIVSGDRVRIVATCDPALHDPIQYPAAIVARSPHRVAAEAFLAFLAGPEAGAILQRHGFAPAGE